MYLKWIECKASTDSKNNFSSAQEAWQHIKKCRGFIGQWGGWDTKHLETACIASLWEDSNSYQQFMGEVHDTVTETNRQETTYSSIDVRFFKGIIPMEGLHKGLRELVQNGGFVRIADCSIHHDKHDHFVDMQKAIWIPEMSRSPGMLGVSFYQGIQDLSNYLVVSFWESLDTHNDYQLNKVPQLRQQAAASKDLKSITGRLIELEASWTVLPVFVSLKDLKYK